jgi:Fe-S cluster assembly protein SufD
MSAPFPTRKDEAYRYADFDALKQIWDALPAPERIEIAAQQDMQQIWLPNVEDVQVRNVEVAVEAGASCTIFSLNVASEYSRISLDVTLGEKSSFAFHAANIGGGESTLEIVTTVRHLAPAATSRQTVRSVLGGKATGSYVGKVAVARDAQQTDSEQSVKAMLLDRGATANCKPELEIFADDVKCAHGASVGELDPAQLFYAESRGLDPAAARALLLEGFIAGLWDDVADEVQRADIAAAARAALRAIA